MVGPIEETFMDVSTLTEYPDHLKHIIEVLLANEYTLTDGRGWRDVPSLRVRDVVAAAQALYDLIHTPIPPISIQIDNFEAIY